jgi:ubiquitin-protein ligase
MSSIRNERLSNDYRLLQRLCAFNEPVKIQMIEGSRPPDYYRLQIFHCKSVESVSNGVPKYRTNHILEISSFPERYPDPGELPSVKLTTPIFHPNIFSDGRFCFRGSELETMTHPLDALVKRIIGMLQYENLRFGVPANSQARDWANLNRHLFPFSSNSSTGQSSHQLNWR